MIDFNDEKYGRVVIYDSKDIKEANGPLFPICEKWGELCLDHLPSDKNDIALGASIIGIRDVDNKRVKLLKNRYGPLEDVKTKRFVLNYGIEPESVVIEEVFDPIRTRFEILDL